MTHFLENVCESVFDSLDLSTSKWMTVVGKNGAVWSLKCC